MAFQASVKPFASSPRWRPHVMTRRVAIPGHQQGEQGRRMVQAEAKAGSAAAALVEFEVAGAGGDERRSAANTSMGIHQRKSLVDTKNSKKKKKKGGGKKGGGGSLHSAAPDRPAVTPWTGTESIMWLLLLVESYRRKAGRVIMDDMELADIAKVMWQAPFALFSLDLEAAPVTFNYANQGMLQLLGKEWGDVVGKELSAVTTDPDAQAALEKLLGGAEGAEGLTEGAVTGFLDVAEGKRAKITDLAIFDVITPTDELVGRAGVFTSWEFDDGAIGGVGVSEAMAVPTLEDVAACEAAVQEQGTAVRELKESQGLTNSDPAVKEAVEELMRRKQQLADMQEVLAKASKDADGDEESSETA